MGRRASNGTGQYCSAQELLAIAPDFNFFLLQIFTSFDTGSPTNWGHPSYARGFVGSA